MASSNRNAGFSRTATSAAPIVAPNGAVALSSSIRLRLAATMRSSIELFPLSRVTSSTKTKREG